MMLKYLIVTVLCLLAGCNTTSDQRIEMLEQGIVQAEASAGNLDVYINDLQEAIAEARLLLQNPDLNISQKSSVLKFMTDTESSLTIAIEKKTAIQESLTEWKGKIALLKEQGSGLAVELQMIGEGIKATSSALPPPFSGYGILAGTLLTLIGGVFGKRKGTASADKTIDGIVASVNTVLGVGTDKIDVASIKAILKDSQIKSGVRDKVIASLSRVA